MPTRGIVSIALRLASKRSCDVPRSNLVGSSSFELVNPDILVCLGGPSAQTLLGIKDGITKTRGRWFTFNTGKREIRAMPTFHPAFLLRSPLQKRFAWRDFLAIKKALSS